MYCHGVGVAYLYYAHVDKDGGMITLFNCDII